MDIDKMTIGEFKELAKLFNGGSSKSLYDEYIGKYVICRSRNEGINAGKVIAVDETGVVLEDARRLWYHKPLNKNVSWYEGVATSGLGEGSRIGCPITKVIAEDYSLTICNAEAEKSLREAVSNEQS